MRSPGRKGQPKRCYQSASGSGYILVSDVSVFDHLTLAHLQPYGGILPTCLSTKSEASLVLRAHYCGCSASHKSPVNQTMWVLPVCDISFCAFLLVLFLHVGGTLVLPWGPLLWSTSSVYFWTSWTVNVKPEAFSQENVNWMQVDSLLGSISSLDMRVDGWLSWFSYLFCLSVIKKNI